MRMGNNRLVRRVYSESRRRWEADGGVRNWCSYTYRLMVRVGLEEEWRKEECGSDWKGIVCMRW